MKLLESAPVLTWLEKGVSCLIDLENSDSTVPWFSASLCPIWGFAADVPNFPLTIPRSTEPWSHHCSSDFGKHKNTHHYLKHQAVRERCRGWQLTSSQAATSLLSRGWKIEPPPEDTSLKAWDWLSAGLEVCCLRKSGKDMRKPIKNGTSLTCRTT